MDFANHQQALFKILPPNSVVLIMGAQEVLRNGDSHYPFRQNSNFYYLSGLTEPNLALIIDTVNGFNVTVFAPMLTDHARIWQGLELTPAIAQKKMAANAAYPIEELSKIFKEKITKCDVLYADISEKTFGFIQEFSARFESKKAPAGGLYPLQALIGQLRKIKTPAEIECMRQSAKIASMAHTLAMRNVSPDQYEYQLQALIEGEFLENNACPSYTSIVAGGKNALVLHYVKNSAQLQAGELVLVDAGCEYQYYASDITRTYPVSGKFSTAQKTVYNAVLAAQTAALKILKGSTHDKVQMVVAEVLTQALCEMGILKGELKNLVETQAYKRFYMHSFGHHLGLDVHDSVLHNPSELYSPGMVVTVEPGLYIPHDADIPSEYRGIGIRIEDDVLITIKGVEVLSTAPKTIEEIEYLCQHKKLAL